MKIVEINSSKCQLKPYSECHDLQTVVWLNDPYIQENFGITYVVNVTDHREWLENQVDLMMWAIHVSNKHVGNVSLRLTPRHKKAYFEIYLGEKSIRGKGVGKLVLQLVLRHAFNDLNLNRIYLYTRPDNKAANNLYKSLGFTQEGVEKESIFSGSGVFYDQILWGMIKSDFNSRCSNE